MKNSKIVSRTKTPQSARKEVFRLLWRIMSFHNGQLPTYGCVICSSSKLSVGYIKGYGNVCGNCCDGNDRVIFFDSYNDIIRLEKLGFLIPIESNNYKTLLEISKKK